MSKSNILNMYYNSINKFSSNILFELPNTIDGKKIWTYNSTNILTNKFKYLYSRL